MMVQLLRAPPPRPSHHPPIDHQITRYATSSIYDGVEKRLKHCEIVGIRYHQSNHQSHLTSNAMGVPKFFRWLSERYPLINQPIHCPPVEETKKSHGFPPKNAFNSDIGDANPDKQGLSNNGSYSRRNTK